MLFCKPVFKGDILYEQTFEPNHTLQFRSLVLKKDLNILQYWSTRHHCRFWQPEGSFEKILSFYQNLLKNPDGHSFIGILDEELICLIDIYRLQTDELGLHIQHKANDCRLHLIMAPCNEIIPGLSQKVMEVFLRYFFRLRIPVTCTPNLIFIIARLAGYWKNAASGFCKISCSAPRPPVFT